MVAKSLTAKRLRYGLDTALNHVVTMAETLVDQASVQFQAVALQAAAVELVTVR